MISLVLKGLSRSIAEELTRTKEALAAQDYPRDDWSAGLDSEVPGMGAPRHVFAQKQPGYFVFPISVPMGNLTVAQLRGLARIAEAHEFEEVRTTQDQNMFLPKCAGGKN